MTMSDRPNVLLITTDQQRYDTLGATTGESWHRTPHLDALAGEGVLFERSYVQNPVCMPSRASLQTGRYPHQHGVDHMKREIDDSPGLPPWELTIMERLQEAGYRTGGTGKLHMMPPKGFHWERLTNGKGARWREFEGSELGRGPLGPTYASWLEHKRPGAYEEIYEQRQENAYRDYRTAITNVLPVEEYIDTWVAEQAIEFLHDPHSDPFFLWCGFMSPHGPVDPPEPYDAIYDEDDVGMPNQRPDPTDPASPKGAAEGWWGDDEALILRWRRHYYGLVALIDELVGRLLETLEDRGLMENTVVIFTSDHGEMAGDWNMMAKGNFYEEVLRVPTIVSPPDGGAIDSTDELVEVADLAPTILEYAGLDVPRQLPTRSLRPFLQGQTDSHGRDAIFSERYYEREETRHAACVRTDRYKYIHHKHDGERELYDLETDPHELTNLATDPDHRDILNNHQKLLIDRLLRGGDSYYRDESPDDRDIRSWLR